MAFKQSIKTGLSFGLISGIITTLGLMIGLHSGTGSKIVVIGGILIIAIADAFSDALGIHVSEESDKQRNHRQVWESTISTFISKFFVALSFVIPVLLFKLSTAILVSVGLGLLLIGFFSFYLAKQKGKKPFLIVLEHVIIALLVIIITHYIGDLVSTFFK